VRAYQRIASAAALFAVSGAASAIPLYDSFGPLDDATFGGTGIPNQEVAVASQFEDGDTTITLGLSATQRYSNPALSNDGAGTYFAGVGTNFGGAGESTSEGALWNFNYYINIDSPTRTIDDYDINIYYDFDPAFDNGPFGLGVIDVDAGVTPLDTKVEGSQNLLFSFLSTGVPGLVTAPTFAGFDPNAVGEYNFAIQVSRAGWAVEQVRMDVQVVPIPAAAVLFPSALAMMGWFRRRKPV